MVDLPGIYSLSTYSQEELVAREFLATGLGDVVIDVLDSTVLERNLYLALQLRELEVPMVLALNLSDLAAKEGLQIDDRLIAREMGAPVVMTAASVGKGLQPLVETALAQVGSKPAAAPRYGKEVEDAVVRVQTMLAATALPSAVDGIPTRFVALKLLERDPEIERLLADVPDLLHGTQDIAAGLETVHGHEAAGVIAAERYAVAGRVAAAAVHRHGAGRAAKAERLDSLLLHRVVGWLALVLVMFAMFALIFQAGGWAAAQLDGAFAALEKAFYGLGLSPAWADFLWQGLIQGVLAGISVALPYLVPFYVILSLLENSGYLARMAFLTDTIMHRLGLHGKAFIPIFLGYGCTVPAILGTRIMERDRDRLIAGILATLVPCSARTVVILGLVGAFVGFWPAVSLYLLDLLIVFVAGRLLNRYLPGESVGLIMEIPRLRNPGLRLSLRQTWFRLKDFVVFAFPIIMAGSLLLHALERLGWLPPIAAFLAPFTKRSWACRRSR